MADFNTAFQARKAMKISVESICADAGASESDRVSMLAKNAEEYAEYMGAPLDHSRDFVAKIAEDAGLPQSVIRKAAPDKQAAEAARRAAAARDKLRRENDPGAEEEEPAPVGERANKMRHATNSEMLKLVQLGLAEEVRKVRAENPRLNESQARSRVFAENPGLYGSLRKLAHGPENEFAKQSSSAEIEAAAKAAEIMQADPGLSHHQAYARAYETTPGLMKRLLAEQREA